MILGWIINITFQKTFSTLTSKKQALALHSLDTMAFIKSEAFTLLFN